MLEEDAERREDDGEDDAHHRHRVVRHCRPRSRGGGELALTDRLAGEEDVLQPGRMREEPRGGARRAWGQDNQKQNREPVLVGGGRPGSALSGPGRPVAEAARLLRSLQQQAPIRSTP